MKKILSLLLALVMLFTLVAITGCDGESKDDEKDKGKDGETKTPIALKVWAAQEDQALTRDLADKFIAANPDKNITITLGVVGEPDAYKTYNEDPEAAADVFFFANDQLRDFVKAGGLYEVQKNTADIIARNVQNSVDAATLDGKLYAYPATADNGYFLYYDKSVLSADDVKTLDRILEVSAAANKKVFMNLDKNGYYVASFFLGAGCTLSIDGDKQLCDFNNAAGLAAAKAMQAFAANPCYINGDDNVIKAGIGDSIAAGISGTWNAKDIAAVLGENYAATKLPTFTMDDKQVQMGSFGGFKHVGVNAMIKDAAKLSVAMDFADFLTNEESQLARFKARAMGPSNTKAANNDEVKANVALAAIAMQNAYAISQNDVLGKYWDPAGAFGTAMVNGDTTDLQTLLDAMVKQIQE